MTIQELQNSIRDLPPADWDTLLAWIVGEERERRNAEKANAQLLDELQEQGKLPKRDVATLGEAKANKASIPAWRNPGTDSSLMYHYGDVVTHKGKVVRSTHQGLNHWEPGTLGLDGRIWEIVKTDKPGGGAGDSPASGTEPAKPAAPKVAEWKPGLNVKPGERYTHQGATYEVIQGHTTQAGWEPPAVPALWKKV